MKYKDVAGMTVEQRVEKRREIELELMKERAQISSGTSPKNPGRIRELKRTLARIEMASQRGKA